MAEDAGSEGKPHKSLYEELKKHELYGPLIRSALLVALTFVIGVVGFMIIGWGTKNIFRLAIDAIYMTTITLTTVGYGETINVDKSWTGQVFTTLLLLGGVGAFVNFFSNLTAFLIEGDLQLLFWRKRMREAIKELNGHTIVCGSGNTGQYVVSELVQTDRDFVLIDSSQDRVTHLEEKFGKEFPAVIGDATDDEALREAGIERASGLLTCFKNDKDNLIVTVSARLINPNLRIVSRCTDERVQEKIIKAGANAVISGARIGGLRMVSEMIRPTAVSFLDLMLRDQDKKLRVESYEIDTRSSFIGKTVGDVRKNGIPDLLIMALDRPKKPWLYNPPDEARLEAGMGLVYMGNPTSRKALEQLAKKLSDK